jgi:septal ring factor EnvC (AmiA/AmiB activator)
MTVNDTQDPQHALTAILTSLDQRLTSQEQQTATLVGDLQTAQAQLHQWEARWSRLTELLTNLSEQLRTDTSNLNERLDAQTRDGLALAEHLIALQEQLDGPGYD